MGSPTADWILLATGRASCASKTLRWSATKCIAAERGKDIAPAEPLLEMLLSFIENEYRPPNGH